MRKSFNLLDLDKLSDEIDWKGTPGMGDAMFGLNTAHNTARRLKKPVQLTYHWYYDSKNKYHCEDPESLIERIHYIHNFYHSSENVRIAHKFDSKDGYIYNERYIGTDEPRKNAAANSWIFREDCKLPVVKNKFVFWRPTYNAEVPRNWKLLLDHNGWDKVVNNLVINGYDPVEICYRTPICEAMYHINTAEFVVCYDGMWHYIAKNFWKPMLVLSNHSVTKIHTPHCLSFDGRSLLHYSQHINAIKRRQILFSDMWVDKCIWRLPGGGSYDHFLKCTGMHQIYTRAAWYQIEMSKRTWYEETNN